MEILLIAYIPLILSLYLSSRMLKSAIRKLDDELKIKLINDTTKDKSLQLGVVGGILVLFLVNMKFEWISFWISSYFSIGILLVMAIFSVNRAYQKLKIEGFPDSYLREMVKGNLLRFFGFLLFLVILSLF